MNKLKKIYSKKELIIDYLSIISYLLKKIFDKLAFIIHFILIPAFINLTLLWIWIIAIVVTYYGVKINY